MTLKAFTMPKWGIEMTEGTVAEWLVHEGEPFARGALIALIETDKITNEVEAEADGCVVRFVAGQGDTLPVGGLVGVYGDPGVSAADIDAFVAGFRPVDASMPGMETAASTPAAAAAPVVTGSDIPAGIDISPAARKLVQEAGIDVTTITGSGPGGRITAQDVELALRGG